MKLKISILFCALILLSLCQCSSSGDPEPEPTAEEKQLEKIARVWKPGVVTHGGEDVTHRFEDFVLTLTKNKAYTASGNLGDFDYEPFKPSGTWDFMEDDLNRIARNDGVDMDVQVSDDELILTFSISESNGRIAGLGSYRFQLVAN